MSPSVALPPWWLGHCPHCNCWVEMNLRKCPHCKNDFTKEQVEAIKVECSKRKREKLAAIYFLLGLVVVVGTFIIIDMELYRSWF
jgi:hypothetical protein